ncbi:hypothetical protein [Dokdonia sp. R86516]|uniref:hypothetical protein n=1 Tax=Dokdonia sp. R86516 TaxID=3093856 RepID=UPI0037C5F7C4
MKKIKFLSLFVCALAFLTACEDEDKRLLPFGEPGAVEGRAGVFVTADITTAVIDGNDVPNGVFAFTVGAPNNNVASFDIIAQRRTPAPLSEQSEFALIKTVTTFPSDVVITTGDLASAFGLTVDELGLGDTFVFRNVATGTQGEIVEFDDLDADLQSEGGQMQGFGLSTLIVCPLPDGYATGDYAVETTVGGFFGDIFLPQTVTLSSASVYQRSFQANYLEQFGIGQPDMTFTINFLCGVQTGRDGMGTNLGCAGGGLRLNSSANALPYSEDDDSSFVINFTEDSVGCGGVPAGEVQITLTKL